MGTGGGYPDAYWYLGWQAILGGVPALLLLDGPEQQPPRSPTGTQSLTGFVAEYWVQGVCLWVFL